MPGVLSALPVIVRVVMPVQPDRSASIKTECPSAMTTASPSAGAPPLPEPPDHIAADQLPEPVEVAVAPKARHGTRRKRSAKERCRLIIGSLSRRLGCP